MGRNLSFSSYCSFSKKKSLVYLVFLIAINFHALSCYAESVSESKYNDFYKRQKMILEEDEKRESNRVLYSKKRLADQQKFEALEAEFAQRSSRSKQRLEDEFAEKWMAEQNQRHEEAMNRARDQYILTKKKKYKFELPESVQYDVK